MFLVNPALLRIAAQVQADMGTVVSGTANGKAYSREGCRGERESDRMQ